MSNSEITSTNQEAKEIVIKYANGESATVTKGCAIALNDDIVTVSMVDLKGFDLSIIVESMLELVQHLISEVEDSIL